MTSPEPDRPAQRFFANALVAVGWLIVGLGGLCTLGFGVMALIFGREFHTSLEDWTLPAGMLAVGGGSLWAGLTIRRALKTSNTEDDDA